MISRHTLFVAEYLKDGNGKAAAIRAGYPASNARIQASKLLAKPEIKAAVAAARSQAAADAELTLAGHLRELADLRDEASRCKQYGAAITAETNRGKAAGFYSERIEHTGEGGGPIEITVTRRIVRPGDGA